MLPLPFVVRTIVTNYHPPRQGYPPNSYDWTIPADVQERSDYRIQIFNSDYASVRDTSDGDFSIINIDDNANCGDGVKQEGEECDDGNSNNNDACKNDCTFNICGDSVKQTDEECDYGAKNGICPSTCSSSCTLNNCPVCGNGLVEIGEDCDDAAKNGICPSTCSNLCTVNKCPVCGNGIIEKGEICDNGAKNGICPSTCSSSCTLNNCPVCGNNICEEGETSKNCPQDCDPVCGNNICEDGEAEVCPACVYDFPPCSLPCTLGTCQEDCQ